MGESVRDPDDMSKEIDIFVRRKREWEPKRTDLETLDSVFFCTFIQRSIG